MRKLSVLLILVLFFTTGCMGKIKRGVQGNTFYSTYPKVAVEMAPEFEYIDKKKENEFSFFRTGENGANFDVEQFSFADRLNRKGGFIRIDRLSGRYVHWIPDITKGMSNYISSGYEEHGGESYQYVVMLRKDNNEECIMIKRFARVVGGNRNTMLNIIYFEPVDVRGLDCKTQWHELDTLTHDQKQFYDEFVENSAKNMKIIDLAQLNLEE